MLRLVKFYIFLVTNAMCRPKSGVSNTGPRGPLSLHLQPLIGRDSWKTSWIVALEDQGWPPLT